MMKIFVNKNDEVVSVAEQVIGAPDTELVLVVPRFSKLADSVANFQLLKREADAAGKNLLIESVDDRAVSLAKANHIEAANPFFGESAMHREMTDIVRRSKETFKQHDGDQRTFDNEQVEVDLAAARKKTSGFRGARESEDSKKTPASAPKKPRRFRNLVVLVVFIALLSGGGAYAYQFLPKAEINLISKKADWGYSGEVLVDKAGAEVMGQLFSKEQNQSFSFPASGRGGVERKAKGTITIYNAFSSSQQYLVATTRFAAPNGKIYRLDAGVTVPGAKISNGGILPSSIDASVSADKPGAEYNTGPIAKLMVPGFQGTPRYAGFYGELKNGASGGVVGETLYPTAEDISKGKESARKSIEEGLKTFLLAQIDSEFRVVPGASEFEIVKENVVEDVASDGKFSIFVDAKMNMTAFREGDMVRFLEAKAQKELGPEFKVSSDYDLKFGEAKLIPKEQKLTVSVTFKGMFAYAIDISNFKGLAKGKAEDDLKSLIFGMPGVQSATVNLWPFWVKSVPPKEDKIMVNVE